MSERSEGLWGAVLRYALVMVCSASLGFGSSELMAVSHIKDQVRDHGAAIKALDKAIDAETQLRREQDQVSRRELELLNAAWDKRMEGISSHIDVLIRQNTELITLIRVQQQVTKGQP